MLSQRKLKKLKVSKVFQNTRNSKFSYFFNQKFKVWEIFWNIKNNEFSYPLIKIQKSSKTSKITNLGKSFKNIPKHQKWQILNKEISNFKNFLKHRKQQIWSSEFQNSSKNSKVTNLNLKNSINLPKH